MHRAKINIEKTSIDQLNFSGRKFNNKGKPPSSAKLSANSLLSNFSRE